MSEPHASPSASPPDVSASWLRVFAAVADTGSFTAAAALLGYTQSAVSRQIASLEGELGAELFDRLPRGVALTEAGRTLLPHARAVLDQLAGARDDLAALRGLRAGRVRVGAFATAGAALVPGAMVRFRSRHPEVSVSLRMDLSAALLRAVGAGELDLAVVAPGEDRLADRAAAAGAELEHLLDEPMLVALERGHPLARRRTVRLAQLAGETWIAGSSRPEETLISSALGPGFRPRIGFVVGDWMAKQGLVAAGLGITLVPRLAADSIRGDLALVPVHPADVPGRAVHLARPRGTTPAPAVRAFVRLLRASAEAVTARPGR